MLPGCPRDPCNYKGQGWLLWISWQPRTAIHPLPKSVPHSLPPNFPFPVLLPPFPSVFFLEYVEFPHSRLPKKKEIPSFLSVSPSAPWRECNKLICIFQHSLTLSSGEMEATAGTFKTKIWVVKDRDKPHSRHFLPVIPTKGDTTQKWSCGWRILQDTQKKSESKSIRNRNSMTL